MSEALVVSIPHRLGRQEATHRIKTGFGNARAHYARFLTIEDETWNDNSMQFRVSALGQAASGKVDVLDDHVRLEVTLPWLLAKFAETIAPVFSVKKASCCWKRNSSSIQIGMRAASSRHQKKKTAGS